MTLDFGGVMGGLMEAFDKEAIQKGEALKKTKLGADYHRAVLANDPEEAYYSLLGDLKGAVEGVVLGENPKHPSEARFLFAHYEFVENHFEKLFEKVEGSAFCADKTRTITRSLARLYMTGEWVGFDYSQEFTYQLPKKIFTAKEEIVQFFEALVSLYYGNGKEYLECMLKVAKIIKGEKP